MRRHLLPCLALLSASLFSACNTPFAGDGSPAIPPGWGDIKVTQAFIAKGQYGRWRTRAMSPRYITIHATENFSRGGTAYAHARMLQTGALKGRQNSLGFVTWHFTVDDHSIYQTLPCTEQGQHADYDGQGNRSSIGIEMCENRGNSRSVTLDRTAKLAAVLMKQYNIPLSNVVPHQHWRMVRYSDGRDLGHKTCPHFLVKRGESDPAWRAFLAQVKRHRDQL